MVRVLISCIVLLGFASLAEAVPGRPIAHRQQAAAFHNGVAVGANLGRGVPLHHNGGQFHGGQFIPGRGVVPHAHVGGGVFIPGRGIVPTHAVGRQFIPGRGFVPVGYGIANRNYALPYQVGVGVGYQPQFLPAANVVQYSQYSAALNGFNGPQATYYPAQQQAYYGGGYAPQFAPVGAGYGVGGVVPASGVNYGGFGYGAPFNGLPSYAPQYGPGFQQFAPACGY